MRAKNREIKKANQSEIGRTDLETVNDNLRKHIEIIECRLKEKEAEIEHHVKKWQFYEQIVKSLTTFK